MSAKVIFPFLIIAMLTNQSILNGVTLQCVYKSYTGLISFDGQNVYSCEVNDNGIFTDERIRIDSIEGEHIADHTNAKVTGVEFNAILCLKFFPQNLQNVFGDLLVIGISSTNLQEINQNDLKVFPKLRSLHLAANKITIINADLFEFNLELRAIYLESNQIFHIDPNVFDHLNNLVYLRLKDNKCRNALSNAYSRSAVLKLIQRVRSGDCSLTD